MDQPKVFISYSHDSQDFLEWIRRFAGHLRANYIDATIDQYVEPQPVHGWWDWAAKEIDHADHVLCVCTAGYQKKYRGGLPDAGKGSRWELEQIANLPPKKKLKLRVILIGNEDEDVVPTTLNGCKRYTLAETLRDPDQRPYVAPNKDYLQLLNDLRGQLGVNKPDLGKKVDETTEAHRALFDLDGAKKPFAKLRFTRPARASSVCLLGGARPISWRDEEERSERVHRHVADHGGRRVNPKNPFKGASSYEYGDRALFFGRENDGAQLFRRLLADREVILHSPSGSGKSSLLNADLFVRLRSRDFIVPTIPFRPSTLFEGSTDQELCNEHSVAIWHWLARSYNRQIDDDVPESQSGQQWITWLRTKSTENLAEVSPIAIVLDQTEEIFTHPRTSLLWQRALFECLSQAARCERVWLIVAVREDFLARLLAYQELFVTELRSRFSLGLFDAQTAESIVTRTFSSANVVLEQEKVTEAVEYVLEGCLPQSEHIHLKDLKREHVIEPLFLQIFCGDWWRKCGGDALQMGKTRFKSGTLAEALSTYVDTCLLEAAKAISEGQGADGLTASESRLRDWLGSELIHGAVKSQGLITEEIRSGVTYLERSYLVRRSALRERTAELAHDLLVIAVCNSNSDWYSRTPNAALWRDYDRWVKGNERFGLLLGMQQTISAVWQYRRLPLPLAIYWRRSLGKWLIPVGTMAFFVLTAFSLFSWLSIQASKQNEILRRLDQSIRISEAKNRQAEAANKQYHAYDLITRASAQLSPFDRNTALAIKQGLEALHDAEQAGDQRLRLTSLAEAVVGRALALPVAVEHLNLTGDVKSTCGSRAQSTHNDCFHSVHDSERDIELILEADRRDLPADGSRSSRHNYSFLSVAKSNGRPDQRKRVWLTVEDEALIKYGAAAMGYPPEESESKLFSSQAWWDKDRLQGFSVSPRGRFYAWSTTASQLRSCLDNGNSNPTGDNAPCRMIQVDESVQLFEGAVASLGKVEQLQNGLYSYRVDILSQSGNIARVSGRHVRRGDLWPSTDLRSGNAIYSSTNFFRDLSNDHVWLVHNGFPPIDLVKAPGSDVEDVKDLKHWRAIWCDQPACSSREAHLLKKDGAFMTFSLDDIRGNGSVYKPELAKKCKLEITAAVELNRELIAAGELKEKCLAQEAGPVLARLSGRSSVDATKVAWNLELLEIREALPKELQKDGFDTIAFDKGFLGLVSNSGMAAVCDTRNQDSLAIKACRLLDGVTGARGIAVAEGVWKLGVAAVIDNEGKVHLFDREGFRLKRDGSETDTGSLSISVPKHDLGARYEILLAKSAGGTLRAISSASDGRVLMREFESVDERVFRENVPIVLTAMESRVHALYIWDGYVYAGSERTSVKRVVWDPEKLKSLACNSGLVIDVPIDDDEQTRTGAHEALCTH